MSKHQVLFHCMLLCNKLYAVSFVHDIVWWNRENESDNWLISITGPDKTNAGPIYTNIMISNLAMEAPRHQMRLSFIICHPVYTVTAWQPGRVDGKWKLIIHNLQEM